MKAITSKSLIVSLLLLTTIAKTNALTDSELSKEQRAALVLITKLYAPIKQKLAILDKQITNIENKITQAVNQFASNPQESVDTIRKSLNKKLNKVTRIREKLLPLQQAIQHCPLALKTERVQKEINQAGLKFLGNLTPANLEKRLNEVQASLENLLNILK